MDLSLLLYEMYKDSIIYYKTFYRKIKREYNIDSDTIIKLINKIWTYQKKKYGDPLTDDSIGFKTREELQRISIKERVRRNSLKRYRERR